MKKIGAFFAVILLVVCDQLTKSWAEVVLKNGQDIRLWPNVFHLTYVENRGAAFGMLSGKQAFLVIMTVGVLIAVIWYWRKIPKSNWGLLMKIALILIISGAIGNLIDRIWLNYVRDFFYFILINFPVFNVADILVVVGVIVLFPVLLFGDIDGEKNKEKNTQEEESDI
ncbi:MAG: signal peptidase II [Cellulosilyticaceae bacterium]